MDGDREQRHPAVGRVPGLGQDAVPGQHRPGPPGLPVLMPEPEVPLQARAGTADAVVGVRRRSCRRRRGGGFRCRVGGPGPGRWGAAPTHGADGPAARPRCAGQTARGPAGPHDERDRGLRAVAVGPGAHRDCRGTQPAVLMVGHHRRPARRRPAAGTRGAGPRDGLGDPPARGLGGLFPRDPGAVVDRRPGVDAPRRPGPSDPRRPSGVPGLELGDGRGTRSGHHHGHVAGAGGTPNR